MLEIRPATQNDLPAVLEIRNAVSPDNPVTLESLEAQERNRRPDLVHRRLMVLLEGRAVGTADFSHNEWNFHPHRFFMGVSVHPAFQGLGAGRALYANMMQELEQFEPQRLTAFTREDRLRGVRFALERGWVESSREWESRLDLKTFDASRFAGALERVQAQGYRIKPWSEFERRPDAELRYYELDQDASRDVPLSEGEAFTFPDLERYWQNIRNNPNLDVDAWFVAVRDGEIAATTQLYRDASDNRMNTGFTGVARAHRRRGLALALKLTALEHARERNVREIRTENAQANRPMLAINEALGFVKVPAWIEFTKVLREE